MHDQQNIKKVVRVVTSSNQTIWSNNRTNRIPRYCFLSHDRYTSIFHSWNKAFKIVGFLRRSPNINPAPCWEHRERRLIWPYYAFQIIRLQVLWSSLYLFRLLALFSVNRYLAIATVPWKLDLWNARRTVFVETGSSRWMLSSAVTFATAVL